jgi:hypothetical protein
MIEWIAGTIILIFVAPVILSGIMSCFIDLRSKENANNNKRQANNNRRWFRRC